MSINAKQSKLSVWEVLFYLSIGVFISWLILNYIHESKKYSQSVINKIKTAENQLNKEFAEDDREAKEDYLAQNKRIQNTFAEFDNTLDQQEQKVENDLQQENCQKYWALKKRKESLAKTEYELAQYGDTEKEILARDHQEIDADENAIVLAIKHKEFTLSKCHQGPL